MALHRLFVAFRPPAGVRRTLLGFGGGIAGARWQDDDQLHCTLRFIGAVDHHHAEDIAAVLGAVRHPPLDLCLAAPGTFSHGSRVDALWIGVGPRDGLKALHDKIDRALVSIGLPPEGRAYLPHITLARFSRSTAPAADLLAGMPAPPPLAFTVDDFRLYESHLGSEYARYEAVARYPLG